MRKGHYMITKWNNMIEDLQIYLLDSLFQGAGKEPDRTSNEYCNAKYILAVLYENISKLLVTGGIAFVLGIEGYFFFFAVIYGCLKYFSFGAHLESSLLCLISGAATYYGCIYLALYLSNISLPATFYFVSYLIALATYYRYAPAVSKKQILQKGRKAILKKQVLVFILFLFIIQHFLSEIYRILIVLALIAEGGNILPFAFYIFGERG